MLEYRCDYCREYPGDVSKIYTEADGTMAEKRFSDSKESEVNEYINSIEFVDTKTDTTTTKIFQVYKDHYCCNLCEKRGTRQRKGELLGTFKEHRTEIETTTYRIKGTVN